MPMILWPWRYCDLRCCRQTKRCIGRGVDKGVNDHRKPGIFIQLINFHLLLQVPICFRIEQNALRLNALTPHSIYQLINFAGHIISAGALHFYGSECSLDSHCGCGLSETEGMRNQEADPWH